MFACNAAWKPFTYQSCIAQENSVVEQTNKNAFKTREREKKMSFVPP